MKKFLLYILVATMALTALFSLSSYFGSANWILDLFSHFKWQYLLVLTTGTISLFILKKKFSFVFLPFIILLLIDIVPLYFGGNKNSSLAETTKIVCINLLSSNREFEEVKNFIIQEDPDLIILQEFNTPWQLNIEPSLQQYPIRLAVPRDDNFGIALYSKIKLSELEQLKLGDSGVPSIQGEMQLGKTQVKLIATHPLPPVGSDYFEYRNTQLAELGEHIAQLESEATLIGDLNTSSYSAHFKDLKSTAELIDTRRGFGELTTWPTWFSLASTTLDHCLITKGISVKSRSVGSDIGSDHLPIVVELGVE